MYTLNYINDLNNVTFERERYENKTIVLTGSTGLIGSYFVDTLLIHKDLNVKIIALVRNIEKAKTRFSHFNDNERLIFIKADLTEKISFDDKVDYVIHAASLTDPKSYALYPVEVMTTNFIGTKNLLDLSKDKGAKFIFISSCEIYGGNAKLGMKENEYGYIDYLNPRACYNEAKIASETLCSSYQKEYGLKVLILRLSRVYGPTMKLEDTKALSQFINNSLKGEDIVLKSKGLQEFNYTYVGDVVQGMLISIVSNNNSICYNLSSDELMPLKDIAKCVAKTCNKDVVFDLPNEIEQAGFSKATVSSLDSSLFKNEFNWKAKTSFEDGINRTISILKEI